MNLSFTDYPTQSVDMATGMDAMTTDFVNATWRANTESSAMEATTSGELPLIVLKQLTGDMPEFEFILPCIFGVFMTLALGLIVFYTKGEESGKQRHVSAVEMSVPEINGNVRRESRDYDGYIESPYFTSRYT